jgi:hypothetical protein
MPSVPTLKLLVAALGIGAFFLGVRLGSEVVRWTGIGLVAAAFLLRFVRPRR